MGLNSHESFIHIMMIDLQILLIFCYFVQDASVWRDRILSILNDEEGSRERAAQLQTALKRDEVTKETYDEFVTFCLGEFFPTDPVIKIWNLVPYKFILQHMRIFCLNFTAEWVQHQPHFSTQIKFHLLFIETTTNTSYKVINYVEKKVSYDWHHNSHLEAVLNTKLPNFYTTYFYKNCFNTIFLSIKGGIKLKHEVTNIKFLVGHDENKEIPLIKRVNSLVMETMKQCWRLKHHPLTQKEDLFQLLPGITTSQNNYILLNLKNSLQEK